MQQISSGLLPAETNQSDRLRAAANKVYGSWQAYEQAISVLAPDQRANYERAGIVLQPRQIEFAHLARLADSPDAADEIGKGGARGGGKSHVVFSQIAVDDCIRFPGLKVLYLRKTAKAGQEQMQDLVRSVLQDIPSTPKATRIDYPNGSRIVIGGYKDDLQAATYQGVEYDVLAVEELTQLTERTYKTLRLSARSSKSWRPRVYATFNPLGIGHMWVKKRFIDPYRENRVGRVAFVPSLVTDNVFNNPEYIETLEDLTGAELQAYRYGNWDVASGAYFDTWDYDTHVINPLDSIPQGWRVWRAMDAGYSHWNIILFFAESGDGDIYVFHEVAHRQAHVETIAPEVIQTGNGYGLNNAYLPAIVAGTDAFRLTAGQQSTLADQYAVYNLHLEPADMSPGSRISGWQLIARKLADPRNGKRPKLYITRNCQRLIDSIPYAERDPKKSEDIRKWDTDANGNGGDDALDCLRYGLVANETAGHTQGNVVYAEYGSY